MPTQQSVIVRPTDRHTLFVSFQGFRLGRRLAVELWAGVPGEAPTRIGQVTGILTQAVGAIAPTQALILSPDGAPPRPRPDRPQCTLVFQDVAETPVWAFHLPEADRVAHWAIEVRVAGADVASAPIALAAPVGAVPARFVAARRATYDWHCGNQFTLYNDASEDSQGAAGAFHDVRKAIEQAQQFVFIVDWSFHPMARLENSERIEATIGYALIQKACQNPDCLIAIHTWDHPGTGAPDVQNDEGDAYLERICQRMDVPRPKNLLWHKSGRDKTGYSHHQKFVVLDSSGPDDRGEITAFFGGLDFTKGRFDWPEHLLLPDGPALAPMRRALVIGQERTLRHPIDGVPIACDDWYNAEFDAADPATQESASLPRQPWHDIYARITGPTAWDFVREFVGRWRLAHPFDVVVSDRFANRLMHPDVGRRRFVQQWEPREGPWCAQVVRSIEKDHWHGPAALTQWGSQRQEFEWRISNKFERSIQDAYINLIQNAEKFIYIETQYFCGEGLENQITKILADKIVSKIIKKELFHVYIILPMYPEGNPSLGSIAMIRKFQWETIDRVIQAIQKSGANWQDYFTVGYLAQCSQTDSSLDHEGSRNERLRNNRRAMIYVHSKFMIVDDTCVLLGSANLNERSLSGDRDSEIGVVLWPNGHEAEERCREQIRAFRLRLWEEHLGRWGFVRAQAHDPATSACAALFREVADRNRQFFDSGTQSQDQGHFYQWPIAFDPESNSIRKSMQEQSIPDSPSRSEYWKFWPRIDWRPDTGSGPENWYR